MVDRRGVNQQCFVVFFFESFPWDDDNLGDNPDGGLEEYQVGVCKGMDMIELYF